MCLFKNSSKIQLAEQDIIVYKVLSKELQSPYYKFTYELNKLYSKDWDNSFIKHCNKQKELYGNMFHVCSDEQKCVFFYGMNVSYDIDGVISNVSLDETQILVKGIIPKGSYYYVGTNSEIGTQKLILTEILYDYK